MLTLQASIELERSIPMSSSIRSIRGIERSYAFSTVQAVSPYAYYPYRDGEAQQAPDYNKSLTRDFQQAAKSAASWLYKAKQAQYDIDQLSRQLSSQLYTDKPIAESLYRLTTMLNHLEDHYKEHADDLRPELWETIELALRHPAAEEVGLRRSTRDGKWMTDSTYLMKSENNERTVQKLPDSSKRMQRLMLGSEGMLNGLKYALTYAEQQKAVDLLQSPLTSTLPYAAYYSSMQTYSPIPYVGLILNRFL
jgi:hypothetical protein